MTIRLLAGRSRLSALGLVLSFLVACLSVPATASAQTSLTGEFTEARRLDLSFDFLGSVARRQAGGFEWYFPAVTFGVTERLEVGAALSATAPRTSDDPREFIAHARWKWLDNARGQTAAIGGAWRVPVSNRDGAAPYGLVLATFSQTFGEARPMTLSAGGYALAGRGASNGTRLGVTLGFDQTITPRWSFSVEWTSGDNWYGYATSGVTFSAGSQWITAGYCIGNKPAANHGPCVSMGRTF